MKVLLRLLTVIILLHLSFQARSQCNNPPDIIASSGFVDSPIGTTSATIGGNVLADGGGGCTMEVGVRWSTNAGGPYTEVVVNPNAGTGSFSVNITSLTAGTQIFYVAYASNDQPAEDVTNEKSFYTLSVEPDAATGSLTTAAQNNDEIDLTFPAASGITNAAGYVILMNEGSAASVAGLTDGQAPGGGQLLTVISDPAATTYTATGLNPNTTYHFAIVPYNRTIHDDTYNYNTTSTDILTANATTAADVAITALTGFDGLQSLLDPLNSGATDVAVDGFSLNASGPVTFQGVVIHFPISAMTGKLSNFRLAKSTDDNFDGIATDLPIAGASLTINADSVIITLSESLSASPTVSYFLVADVDAAVNTNTGSVEFSWNQTDFTFDPVYIDAAESQSRVYEFEDVTPPVLQSTLPADDAAAVDISTDKLILTFNENVDNLTDPAGDNEERVILYKVGSPDVAVHTVDRGSVVADGTSPTVEVDITGQLEPHSDYYVMFGDDVIVDKPDNRPWGGISDATTFNFSTSGVTINAATANICGGSFQAIPDIVISETGIADFNTGNDHTLTLSLANTSEFVFSNSGVTVESTGADITGISFSMGLTTLSITYDVTGGTVLDDITISGLKVYATGDAASTTIIRTTGTAAWDGDNGAGGSSPVYSTINVGATPPDPPQLAASQDLIHCVDEDISAKTLTLVDQDPLNDVTYNWYSDPSLSALVVSTDDPDVDVNIVSELGLTSPAVAGTSIFYVVAVGTCQSAPPVEIEIQVAPKPVADAGADRIDATNVCAGEVLTLGGNPTLQTPSAAGSYTYLWNYLEGTPEPAAVANPEYTLTNGTADTVRYNFEVAITDVNGCVGKDTVTIDVKPPLVVSLTSPNSNTFTPTSPNQTLTATPAGGVFSGVGVVQSETNVYEFSPEIAHATDPATLPKFFTVYYTVTSDGCTVTNEPIATFTISNSFFTSVQSEYCSNEYLNINTGEELQIDANGISVVNNRRTQWNTSDRFFRGPGYVNWASGGFYSSGTLVRYSNEYYRCTSLLCGGLFAPPPSVDNNWSLENILKVTFNGMIRNYYDGYYGGAFPDFTVKKVGSVYRMRTDINYSECPNCTTSFPAAYLEFQNPGDIKYLLPPWSSTRTYRPGDVVVYNNLIWSCRVITSGTAPSAPTWANVTTGNFDTGQYFQENTPTLRSGFYVAGQGVRINRIPDVAFTGLVDAQQVCTFGILDLDVNASVSAGNVYTLTGNFSDAGVDQEFSVQLDGTTGFDEGGGAITNDAFNPGIAMFDTKAAFLNSSGASASSKEIDIRYEVDPGTIGSTGNPCYGSTVITINVLQNSEFDFDPDVVDPEGAVYCYTEPSKTLQAEKNNIVISGSSGTPNSVIFSGFGVSDLGNSVATFTPALGIEQLSPGTTEQQPISITATYRDVNQCLSKRVRTFDVNPKVTPSFDFGGRLNYCYEDQANSFLGQTHTFTNDGAPAISTGKYEFSYKDPGGTSNLLATISSNNTSFLSSAYYDDVQALLTTKGFTGDLNQTVSLNVVYIESLNADKVCSESYQQNMVINPPQVLDIFGLSDGDILCRNDNANLSQGNVVTFEGSVTGSGIFNLDDDNDFNSVNPTLNGTVNTTGGKATINLLSAYNAASGSGDSKVVFLQYLRTAAGCTGPANVVKSFAISSPPPVSYDFSAGNTPMNTEPFCFEDTPVQLKTNQSTNVTITGHGVSDSGLGNGMATFSPELAFNTSVSEGGSINAPQNVVVTARIVDGFGCANNATLQYTVNPVPEAGLDLDLNELNYCYEDPDVVIQGDQANSWFRIEYSGVTTPYTDEIGDINNPEPQIIFQPDIRFDESESRGASALTPASFDLYYTVADNNQCTNTLGPYTLTVANQIDVSIAGLTDSDIFCSNENNGVKALVFNPFPQDPSKRTFTINGQPTPLTGPSYNFSPALAGNDYTLEYVVISGNNCTNTETTNVKVLASPQAIFSAPPACDGDLINFTADGANNLASALYTWTLSDSVKTGQSVQHRFPVSNIYGVQLKVEYPAYNNDPSLVCRDSLRLDQTVGAVPTDLNFKFFNVCEEDETTFEIQSDVPVSQISWDFGDGTSTGFGFSADQIQNVTNTSGLFLGPGHSYATSGNYTVVVTGKTTDIYGGCEYSEDHEVAILKNWVPAEGEMAYDMSALDGGKGFWVTEDANGNATWDFAIANKQNRIRTDDMVWVTGATTPYKAEDASYVNSPCFDLSGFDRPVLSIEHWTDTEPTDGAVLQYSVDGGDTWQRLGNVASGLDWYNQITIPTNPGNQTDLSSGWSTLNQEDWAFGKHALDVLPGTERDQVRFRVAFSSYNNARSRDGFAFKNVRIEERNRTILVENFSSVEQTGNNNAFKDFRANAGIFNTKELVKLQYHHASIQSAPDALNQDNPMDNNARAAFYGVMNPVRAFIDGGFGQSSDNATFTSPLLNTYFSLRSLVTSPVNISIDFEQEPRDKLNVKATVQATSDLGSNGQYNIFIAIAEQEVQGQVYVLRKFLPKAAGTPLTSLSPTAPAQELNVSYDMRHVTRLDNGEFAPFAVIVFVQHLESKDVLQTVMRQDGTISAEIVTGLETTLENYIRLYPNPADDLINIILPAPVKTELPLKIFDTFGKQVYTGAFRTGENVKTINTKSLSGGVYLIQLSTPEGHVRKKAMVVHE